MCAELETRESFAGGCSEHSTMAGLVFTSSVSLQSSLRMGESGTTAAMGNNHGFSGRGSCNER